MRIVPLSTRSWSAGAISPVHWLPGNPEHQQLNRPDGHLRSSCCHPVSRTRFTSESASLVDCDGGQRHPVGMIMDDLRDWPGERFGHRAPNRTSGATRPRSNVGCHVRRVALAEALDATLITLVNMEGPALAHHRGSRGRSSAARVIATYGRPVHVEVTRRRAGCSQGVDLGRGRGSVRRSGDHGTIANDPQSVRRLPVQRLGDGGDRLAVAYEAGPNGMRSIASDRHGHRGASWSPSSASRCGQGDLIKTDRRDAAKLARLLRSGDLGRGGVPRRPARRRWNLVRATG